MKYFFLILITSASLYSCTDTKVALVAQIDEVTATMKQEDFPSQENMEKVIALYDEYISQYPEDVQTYNYMELKAKYQSANNQFKEAIATYDELMKKYPNHEKNADALFMQAFIYENQLMDKTAAREIYTQFIETYPKHELTPSAQFSIDNLFLTDEEIMKKFESITPDSLAIIVNDSVE